MKKLIQTSKSILLLALLFNIAFSSCKKPWWGNEDNGGSNGHGNSISTKAVVVRFGCGLSIYSSNLWLRTFDGKFLQPCEQSFVNICPTILHEDDTVEIKYSKYTKNNPNFDLTCKIVDFPYSKVCIDFLQLANKPSGLPFILFDPSYDSKTSNGINILGARISGNRLYLNVGFSGCDNNVERFSLLAKGAEDPGVITYKLKLYDNSPQMCQAYFTKEIGFDISPLKYTIDGFVKLKIEGYNDVLTY